MSFSSKLKFDNFRYIVNFLISKIIFLLTKKNNRWAFGSGTGLLENNIASFLEYCNKNDKDVFFVTNRKAILSSKTDFEIVYRGSIKAYLYCLQSEVLVFDDYYSDLAPGFFNFMQGLKVNVNHGQEGLKKLAPNYYANITADIMCSASEFEKRIKIDYCGALKNSVYVTGLPRYDDLFTSDVSNNDILFFPTWREDLSGLSREDLVKTDYYKLCISFLFNSDLSKLLKKNGSKIYFKPHLRMGNIDLTGVINEVVLVSENESLTDVIKKTSILVTDYSSVTWDYIYTSRQVIFFQYDLEQYKIYPGMYINDDDSLFEYSCVNQDGLLAILDDPSTFNVSIKSVDKYFSYKDKDNCLRLYNLIDSKLKD